MGTTEIQVRFTRRESSDRNVVALGCACFIVICTATARGEGAAPSDLKRLELSRKSEELARVSSDVRALERAKREFLLSQKACKKKVAAIEQRKADIDKALAGIRSSLPEVLRAADDVMLKPKEGHFKELLAALRLLPRSSESTLERRRMDPFPITEFGPNEAEAESVVKSVIAEGRESMADDKPTDGLEFLDAAKKFIFAYEDDDVLKGNIVDELKKFDGDIAKVSTEAILADLKGRQQPWCDALDTSLTALEREIADRGKAKADLETVVARLSDEIQTAADSSEARNKTLLTWATIGLIVVLPLLFLLMALFADPVKEKIIENRTLIELVSMAFLLLTIIMLGTANKLMPEAIGTLLGTIAGYIFGRHTFNGSDGGK